jgi:anaerobic selenocysteine-containing dehydrogenase
LSGAYGLRKDLLERPDLMRVALGREARAVNMVEIGRELLHRESPPIQAVFVYNSNPVAVAPDHEQVLRGFSRRDLFVVVHEQFFTDTTDYADIVLPATTFFEHKELQTSYGHYFLQHSDTAIPPVGEACSNFQVFKALAAGMGFDEDCFRETEDDAMDAALESTDPWLNGIDRVRLEKEGHVRLKFPESHGVATAQNGSSYFLPFAQGGFSTPSGKAEFYSETLAAAGLDPVVSFKAPSESRHAAAATTYPLELLARKADNFLNTTFCNLTSTQAMEERGLLEMCAHDANARGIQDGDAVRLFNSRGELRLKARVNGAVQRGVVAARLDWAKLSTEGKNVNVLTSDRLTDIGDGATFYSTLVEVERA